MSAERNSEKSLVGRRSATNPAGELTACYFLPKNPTPLSAFGLDFRPSGLIGHEIPFHTTPFLLNFQLYIVHDMHQQ